MLSPQSKVTHQSILETVIKEFEEAIRSEESKTKNKKNYEIRTVDCLMSCLAMFSLKKQSLLQFDRHVRQGNDILHNNIKTLYNINRIPCDTQMRTRLDGLPLYMLHGAYREIISSLQRSKRLENWKFMNEYYVISVDGTEFFSSREVFCEHCCTKVYNKEKKDEYTIYNHQMVVGSIVHPNMRQVLPIGFEPIIRSDGEKKNDCERNASKRWLENFRKNHPQLSVIIVADGLSSNAPFIKELIKHRCKYILVAKNKDHISLCDYFWAGEGEDICEFEEAGDKFQKKYRFMKNVPLNDSNPDVLVNVVYYEETNKHGKKRKWIWVTNLDVTKENVKEIVLGGRSRWKIENETFNTLKNQGYNFEHNYGHGDKTLSNFMAGMMLLAFLIDQCLEAFNSLFQDTLKKFQCRRVTWETLRSAVYLVPVDSWDMLYQKLINPRFDTENTT